MKLGIITLLGDNYGNRLQNYAVQEILKQYAKEVCTIKYQKKQPINSAENKSKLSKLNPFYVGEVIQNRLKNIYHLNVSQRTPVGNLVYFCCHKKKILGALDKRKENFSEFDNKYISYENELLHIDGDDGKPWVNSYDAFVCGSDQIWNPKYPTASRLAFLQFAPKNKRIAFSPSIGITDTDAFDEDMKKWLCDIPNLSVREAQGVPMLESITGRTPELLLDPTMLLDKLHWDKLAEQGKTELPEDYALCYFLGNKETKYEKYISAQLKQKKLCRVELLNSEYPEYLSLAPQNMVYALKNAKVVYTDSFHGAVFSILYNKPFVVFNRSEKGASMNSRISTLLKHFGLEEAMFCDGFTRSELDFSKAKEYIEAERNKAESYLKNALKNASEGSNL